MLDICCWVNSELRQNSSTSDSIFSVTKLVRYISRCYMTQELGDVISTGAPEGVILGMAVKGWLRSSDVVDVEIGELGWLTTMFKKPTA